MEKELTIIGKDLDSGEREKVGSSLREGKELARHRFYEGALRKTQEMYRFIRKMNEYLAKEWERLGIKEKHISIEPGQIHGLPHEKFLEFFLCTKETPTITAACRKKEGEIFIDGSSPRSQCYFNMLHEALHVLSFEKYFLNTHGELHLYRQGYEVMNPEVEHSNFGGLNEMIVDKLAAILFFRHAKELVEEFKVKHKTIRGYDPAILDKIIEKVATTKGEKQSEVWQRLKRGLFTGEMMHLKDIERTFGKGSFRVIAFYKCGIEGVPDEELRNKILRYLETNDEEEKKVIEREIFEREG